MLFIPMGFNCVCSCRLYSLYGVCLLVCLLVCWFVVVVVVVVVVFVVVSSFVTTFLVLEVLQHHKCLNVH